MKKNDYRKAVEMIKPEEGVKEVIWDEIMNENAELIKKSPKARKGRAWGYVAAALALVCVVSVSAPAVASELRSLILRETPSYEPLNDAIETSVFTKSDEHIQVTVEELLSDGVVVDMTVKYTALDEVGKQWLDTFEVDTEQYIFSINLKPHMINTIEYGVNYSYGTVELKDRATETERVFLVGLQTSGRTYSDNQGVFTFPLTETTETAMLDISGNVEIRSFKLHGEGVASEYYTPTYIEISPMSFVIYANNHGVYERIQEGDYRAEKWLLPDEEIDSLEKNSYFIMKDGSKEQLPRGAHNTTHSKPENMYSDVMLYSEKYYDISDNNRWVPKLMNLDDFEAVVINGVRFEFEQ